MQNVYIWFFLSLWYEYYLLDWLKERTENRKKIEIKQKTYYKDELNLTVEDWFFDSDI